MLITSTSNVMFDNVVVGNWDGATTWVLQQWWTPTLQLMALQFIFYFYFMLHPIARVFKVKASAREIEWKRQRKRTFPGYITPSISALLVGRSVTTQVPFGSSNIDSWSDTSNTNTNNTSNNNTNNTSNNNTNNTGSNTNNTSRRNLRTQSQKKSIVFNIKQQRRVFLELSYKEGKNM